MPKLKPHSGEKRFKLSKNGKVRSHAYMTHLANGHGKPLRPSAMHVVPLSPTRPTPRRSKDCSLINNGAGRFQIYFR